MAYDLRVMGVWSGIVDDDGAEWVEVLARLPVADYVALRASLRPGQSPEMLADPARDAAVPLAAGVIERDP